VNKKTKKLNKLNNELDKQIAKENQEDFTNMICYLRGANISEYDQELVRQDLTEMLLSAQNRGESIHSVFGEDFKAFCDDVIASLPEKTRKQKLAESFNIACWGLSILGFIGIVTAKETIFLIRDFFLGKELHFHIAVSFGMVLRMGITFAAAVIIVEAIIKNSFKKTNTKNRGIMGALAGGGMMAIFLLSAWFGKGTLFTVNIFIALAVVLIVYAAHKLLEQV